MSSSLKWLSGQVHEIYYTLINTCYVCRTVPCASKDRKDQKKGQALCWEGTGALGPQRQGDLELAFSQLAQQTPVGEEAENGQPRPQREAQKCLAGDVTRELASAVGSLGHPGWRVTRVWLLAP